MTKIDQVCLHEAIHIHSNHNELNALGLIYISQLIEVNNIMKCKLRGIIRRESIKSNIVPDSKL